MKEIYQNDIMKYRKHLRDTIHVLKRQKDSERKFEKLLNMTKEYEMMTVDLEKSGHKVKCTADWMKHSYWESEYKNYCIMNGKEIPTVKVDESNPLVIKTEKQKKPKSDVPKTVKISTVKPIKTNIKENKSKTVKKTAEKKVTKSKETGKYKWKLTLSWSVESQPKCNSCGKVVESLKKYLLDMGLKEVSTSEYDFVNRVEYTMDFLYYGTETEYIIIRNSADYIAMVVDAPFAEKCSIGIFGKKVDN